MDNSLKVWWEAYGSSSYILPTGNALWLIDEQPTYLVMEYDQSPNQVKVQVHFVLLYSNSGHLPGSTFDYNLKTHQGWTTSDSLTSTTKASIDLSISGIIEGFTPSLSTSVSNDVTNAATITNEASQDLDVSMHFDLSNPVYLYQAQITVHAPGYGTITGFGGYFTTGESLPPMPKTDEVVVHDRFVDLSPHTVHM